MSGVATFTYNGTNTVTAHITGATVGHTYWMYVQDDNWARYESMVAPTSAFTFVYSGSVGCSPVAPRYVFAWDDNAASAVIGATIFDISSGNTAEYSFPATWDYDGVNTVTVTLNTAASDVIGLDTSIGNFDEFHSIHGTSPGGLYTIQLTTAVQTQVFFANVYRYTGSPYDVWSCRVFTPGVAGGGSPGNPGANVVPVVTGAATSVADRSATLNATVNPEGVSSTVHFEYGLTTNYPFSTTPENIGAGSSPVAVDADITGLLPGRQYHFRAVRTP